MAEIQRVFHFRDIARHQPRIAAIPVTGKDHTPRGNGLACAIGTLACGAKEFTAGRNHQIDHLRTGHDHGLGRHDRLLKPCHKPLPRDFRDCMHPVVAVSGIQKIIKDMEGNIVTVGKPVQCLRDLIDDGTDMIRVGAVLVLGHDVSEKHITAVLDGLRALCFCLGSGNEAR